MPTINEVILYICEKYPEIVDIKGIALEFLGYILEKNIQKGWKAEFQRWYYNRG